MKNIFALGKVKITDILKLSIGGYILYLGLNFIAGMLIIFSGIKIYGWQIGDRLLPFIDKNLLNLGTNFNIAIIVAVIAIILPIIEEILFRGLLLNYFMEIIENQRREFLRKHQNSIVVISSAAIYAMIMTVLTPFQNSSAFGSILPITVFGLILSAITIKSKSLYPAIILHVLNNLVLVAIEIFLFKM